MKRVYKRVSEFLDEIKMKNNDNVLVVTYEVISRAICWYFYGVDSTLFTCENCKIYKYNIYYKNADFNKYWSSNKKEEENGENRTNI